jgi:hypothetical protein
MIARLNFVGLKTRNQILNRLSRIMKANAIDAPRRPSRGTTPMTTLTNLLARKQKLLERLQDNPGRNERDEIERLIAQIDTALDLLKAPDESSDDR